MLSIYRRQKVWRVRTSQAVLEMCSWTIRELACSTSERPQSFAQHVCKRKYLLCVPECSQMLAFGSPLTYYNEFSSFIHFCCSNAVLHWALLVGPFPSAGFSFHTHCSHINKNFLSITLQKWMKLINNHINHDQVMIRYWKYAANKFVNIVIYSAAVDVHCCILIILWHLWSCEIKMN